MCSSAKNPFNHGVANPFALSLWKGLRATTPIALSLSKGWARGWLALVLAAAFASAQAQALSARNITGVGRTATPAEVAAWDIDVRPDFKGLPAGSGTVAQGQKVWEDKCASCHGVFGESNQVFNPIVGGTTAADVASGRVAMLTRPDYPGRTTLMKLAHVSTLWDYINRAMPWSQPKSLSVDEVYAVTAYILNMGEIVPDNFTLSDKTIAQAQARLPNRNGLSTKHALWPGRELGGTAKPDVMAVACMTNCEKPGTQRTLPAFARNAHGNLAEQNRTVGAQHGVDTTVAQAEPSATTPAPAATAAAASPAAPAPKPATPAPAAPATPPAASTGPSKEVQALLQKNSCTACHAAATKIVGPSWADISKKHAGKADYLAGKIRSGGSGVWGAIPMPPQSLSDAEARAIASWLAQGNSR